MKECCVEIAMLDLIKYVNEKINTISVTPIHIPYLAKVKIVNGESSIQFRWTAKSDKPFELKK